MIAIIDYGMGNLGSIKNMLKKIGEPNAIITNDIQVIDDADGIILPGVGSFDMGVTSLKESGIDVEIKKLVVVDKKPILGICLGMQLLGNKSEEGTMQGLSLIDFECKKFNSEFGLRIPHMGWDYINIENDCSLSNNLPVESRFYFVHSYKAVCKNDGDIFMSCEYGEKFAAAVHKDNIYGVQFHPEKSLKYGMALMTNFVEVCKNV